MIDKKELNIQINLIMYDMLDNIISPMCEVGRICADPFLANIGCYTGHRKKEIPEEEEVEEIIQKICERYGIKSLYKIENLSIVEKESLKDVEFISPIQNDWTLASIALYILLHGDKPDFYSHNKCNFCDKENSIIIGPNPDTLICLDCADKFTKGEIK